MIKPGILAVCRQAKVPVATFIRCFTIPVSGSPGSRLGREVIMKSFWIGSIAAVIIAVVAGVVLSGSGMTSGEKYSTASTRL